MTTTSSFFLGIGDDWVMPVTYRNPPNQDGSPGTPINLTGSTVGGELFLAGHSASALSMTVASGGIVASDPSNGAFTFLVPLALTATAIPDNPLAKTFPNRLQVWVIDSLGHRETIAVFAIRVFDPRFVDPSSFPQNQSATIVAAGVQGPAGPAASVNGHTGPAQTLTAADVGAYSKGAVDALIAGLASQIAALQTPSSPPSTPSSAAMLGPDFGGAGNFNAWS